MEIIAVDWAKSAAKRSAYRADLGARTISRVRFDGSLVQLLEYAGGRPTPVLIGIDAAIGYPSRAWKQLRAVDGPASGNFIDFLFSPNLPGRFFDPIALPEDWLPERPFISPPPSQKWSLRAFHDAANGGLLRRVDKRLNGQPIFVTSGLPGTVGSGTLALWRELIKCRDNAMSVWPFHGCLTNLLQQPKPIVCEIYPKACYGIALATTLPSPMILISKTRRASRIEAIDALRDSTWLHREKISVRDADMAAAAANEDDFDALMSAAALTRIFLENAPIETEDLANISIEGGVLGEGCLTRGTRRFGNPRTASRPRKNREAGKSKRFYACPIQGCEHVFRNSRGGWDAHVASFRRHPSWRADIRDPAERKLAFKLEFTDWF